MSRFDPISDADYGYCLNCKEKFNTKNQADDHMRKTLEACPPNSNGRRSGHSVRISNPPRERNIRRAVQSELDDVVSSFYSTVDDWIARDELNEDEAKDAMKSAFVDVADGWEEYSNE